MAPFCEDFLLRHAYKNQDFEKLNIDFLCCLVSTFSNNVPGSTQVCGTKKNDIKVEKSV